MINFEGAELFKINVNEINLTDEGDHRKMILFNIMSDASGVIDIDLFKKTPIASVIFSYSKDDEWKYDLDLEEFKKKTTEDLARIITCKSTKKLTIINSNNSEYKYISECLPETRLHSSLFIIEINTDTKSSEVYTPKEIRNYVIAAIPCRGIIAPMKKSKGFVLFNGELVMTGDFVSSAGYTCNRIVYIFAQVNSFITIEEFYHDPGEYIGLCTVHTIGGLWFYGADPLLDYENFIESNTPKSDLVVRPLNYKIEHFPIPYDGNEELFKKTGGNIFSISTSSRSNDSMRKVIITA